MQLALQEQVAGRSRMIAGIGHDLRTYITRLSLRAELLPDEVQRAKVLGDLQGMTNVVNQSLELGAADQISEDLQVVQLATFIPDAVAPFIETGQAVSLGHVMPSRVELRQTAFLRAFQNLIENALRYGERATVWVKANALTTHIYIDDEGPGIPDSQRQEVLKPFVRLEESRNRQTGGTGLGLTLATMLLAQQQGKLELAESPTGGLRAIIILPRLR